MRDSKALPQRVSALERVKHPPAREAGDAQQHRPRCTQADHKHTPHMTDCIQQLSPITTEGSKHPGVRTLLEMWRSRSHITTYYRRYFTGPKSWLVLLIPQKTCRVQNNEVPDKRKLPLLRWPKVSMVDLPIDFMLILNVDPLFAQLYWQAR